MPTPTVVSVRLSSASLSSLVNGDPVIVTQS